MNHKAKILVVDDDAEALELVRVMLEREKFDVIEASAGEEALEILESEDADLVISDVKLSGMSGVDLLNELHEWDTRIPVILISAWTREKDWLESMHANASAMIPKPLRKETFMKAVHKAIQESKLLRAV